MIAVLLFPDLFQIACEEQEVPKIILRLMNIAVGDILMHRFFNRAAVNQSFQVTFRIRIGFAHHFAHDAVRGRIRPVW